MKSLQGSLLLRLSNRFIHKKFIVTERLMWYDTI